MVKRGERFTSLSLLFYRNISMFHYHHSLTRGNHLLVFFFLFIGIIFLSYSNSLQAEWQLDDLPNILHNSQLHVTEFSPQQLLNTFQAHPNSPEKIYRPLPCLTFGLNWYIGQDNVFGYHVVNIFIHILTAWFLFLTLHLLLKIHYKNDKNVSPHFFLCSALLGALLWALAPIQTQAVTYIVQRMAAMAAMFSIIGIYTYLRGRTSSSLKEKYICFALCLLSFCAALGSKENAILLPISLFLIEVSFFNHEHISKNHIISTLLVTATAFTAGFFFTRYHADVSSLHLSKLFGFLEGYDTRSFTFKERLLTEPRIVLMYLTQIFIPSVERFSIEHDIILSTSFFSPWTTLPAIGTIFFIVSGTLFFLKKHPILCFPILFFFLNHTVESTIAPLELVFEHRNYLPSLFLFLPIGILVGHILYSMSQQPTFRRVTAILCTILFLIISGHATYTRNQTWTTVNNLWSDTLHKAPNSSRAAHYLGRSSIQSGHYKQAQYYFQLALKNAKKAASPKTSQKLALNGSGLAASLLGKNEEALQYYNQCLNIDSKDESCLNNKILTYLQLKQPQKALAEATKLTQYYPTSFNYKYLVASSAYLAEDYETAMTWMQKIASRSLDNHKYAYLTGLVLMQHKAYTNSLFFLKKAQTLSPNSSNYLLALATAYYADNKQTDLAQKTIEKMLNQYSLATIMKEVSHAKQQNGINNDAIKFIEQTLTLTLKNKFIFP